MPACESIFVKVVLSSCQERFSILKSFIYFIATPTISCIPKTHSKNDYVALGRLILEFPRMMFDLLRNTKIKMMAGVAFVLFFPTESARDCGS